MWVRMSFKDGSSAKDTINVNNLGVVIPKTHLPKGANKQQCFLKYENGEVVEGKVAKRVRKYTCRVFYELEQNGLAPKTWGEGTANVKMYFYARVTERFPFVGFWEDNWKAEYLATQQFPQWRVKLKNRALNASEQKPDGKKRKWTQVKKEGHSDSEDSDSTDEDLPTKKHSSANDNNTAIQSAPFTLPPPTENGSPDSGKLPPLPQSAVVAAAITLPGTTDILNSENLSGTNDINNRAKDLTIPVIQNPMFSCAQPSILKEKGNIAVACDQPLAPSKPVSINPAPTTISPSVQTVALPAEHELPSPVSSEAQPIHRVAPVNTNTL
ncbi:hypothetical protein PQX77_021013 [Marasmius sp. AFHP31]|nr:hypothetical protein PQX77_021013 [Marasmius sp. AFHP31]